MLVEMMEEVDLSLLQDRIYTEMLLGVYLYLIFRMLPSISLSNWNSL